MEREWSLVPSGLWASGASLPDNAAHATNRRIAEALDRMERSQRRATTAATHRELECAGLKLYAAPDRSILVSEPFTGTDATVAVMSPATNSG